MRRVIVGAGLDETGAARDQHRTLIDFDIILYNLESR